MREILRHAGYFFSSLGIFESVLLALNSIGVVYYPTIRRITWERVADLSLTGSRDADLLLMALGLSVWLLLMLKDKRGFRMKLRDTASSFLLLLIAIEAGALLRWLGYPFFPTKLYSEPSWHLANLEMQLFYISGLLTPYIFVLLFFWWLIRPLSDPLVKGWHPKFSQIFSNRLAKMILLFSVLMGLVVAIYPYIPSVNPSEVSVSVDVRFYKEWIGKMNGFESVPDAIVYAFTKGGHNGDRPIPLLLMYSIGGLSGNEEWAIRLMPLLLGPLLILAVFYFVKKGTDSLQLASVAALFTLFSYHETIGLYSGFFANWVALIFSYLFMAYLVSLWDSSSFRDYTLAILSSLGVLLSHSATWTMLMIGFALFSILTMLKDPKKAKSGRMLILVSLLIVCVIIDQARTLTLSAESGVEWGVEITSPIGIQEFMRRWYNVAYATYVYLGGFYTNLLIPLFALYAAIFMSLDDRFESLLLGMIALGSVAFALGNYGFQVRVLYNLPIQVLSALGFYSILEKSKKTFEPWFLLSVFLIVFQFEYLFRTLANLPF